MNLGRRGLAIPKAVMKIMDGLLSIREKSTIEKELYNYRAERTLDRIIKMWFVWCLRTVYICVVISVVL